MPASSAAASPSASSFSSISVCTLATSSSMRPDGSGVLDEVGQGQPRDLSPHRFEAGQDHRFRGVVDDQIDTGGLLEGADVAALAADDAAFISSDGRSDDRDRALDDVLGGDAWMPSRSPGAPSPWLSRSPPPRSGGSCRRLHPGSCSMARISSPLACSVVMEEICSRRAAARRLRRRACARPRRSAARARRVPPEAGEGPLAAVSSSHCRELPLLRSSSRRARRARCGGPGSRARTRCAPRAIARGPGFAVF